MRRLVALALLLIGAFWCQRVAAKVFYARDEALRVAFPGADTIETQTFFLNDEQVREVEGLARARLESKLVTVYVGKLDQRLLGYALIDIHIVRTLPEAAMTVLSPDGKIASTLILAFHEPLEYLPPGRWLRQFDQKVLAPGLAVGREIHGIAGATLTAHAITESVRRALALYRVLLAQKRR